MADTDAALPQPIRRPSRPSRPAIPMFDPVVAMSALCDRIGHRFADSNHLVTALTHPSWRNEHNPGGPDNQRLEFLGDAVLGMIVTLELIQRLPDRKEGELTVIKSQLVRESSLAALAEKLHVGPALRLGRGEHYTGGRTRPSVLADALEAVVGAVFLDAGYEVTRTVVVRALSGQLTDVIAQLEAASGQAGLSVGTANWKTAVQELLQRLGHLPPTYLLLAEDGPVHARRFRVRAATRLHEATHEADGEGPSKKVAENDAAAGLFQTLLAATAQLR
ncbi:MAG: ribonuclease III [Myxococcales bacterium]|nr:ribonuclease III [Myxococcales bacterium]